MDMATGFARGGFRTWLSVMLFASLGLVPMPAHSQKTQPSLYGSSGISYLAVRQGGLGSCFFHASVAALARANPDLLRGAIKQAAPDSFVVTFSNGAKETVDIQDVIYARENGYDHSDGLWVAILLRGYGQITLRNALLTSISATTYPDSIKKLAAGLIQQNDLVLNAYDRAIRTAVAQTGDLDPGKLMDALNTEMTRVGLSILVRSQVDQFLSQQEFLTALGKQVRANGELFGVYRSVGQGGFVRRVLEAFGGKVETVGFDNNVQDARPALRLVHTGRAPGVATTRDNPSPNNPAAASSWFVADHAFTVLDYDESTDMVTLRNPWGDHPGADGVFQLSFADFLHNYDFMDVSTY